MTMDDGCHVKGRSRLSLIEGSAIFKADWQLRFENFEAELSGADEQRYNVQAQQEVACVCSAMTFETNARSSCLRHWSVMPCEA